MAGTNLAIWIALLSFASSMLVVLITSSVTLAGKKIDAQQKKDEQSFALKTLYLTRKLNAGEKAIGKLNLLIKTLAWLRQYYFSLTQASYFDEDFDKKKKLHFENIFAKYTEASYEKDDTYLAYFPIQEDFHDSDNIIIRVDNIHEEIQLLLTEANRIFGILDKEKDATVKHKISQSGIPVIDELEEKVRAYIILNDEARIEVTNTCERIRKQMEAVTS